MTIECYKAHCRHHSAHSDPDDGPFCYEEECNYSPATSVMRVEYADSPYAREDTRDLLALLRSAGYIIVAQIRVCNKHSIVFRKDVS